MLGALISEHFLLFNLQPSQVKAEGAVAKNKGAKQSLSLLRS